MKRWERGIRPLPLRARPMAGETTVSFVARLAAVNDFPATLLFRTIGDCVPGRHVLHRDAYLNGPALERLVVLSRTPADHLRKALPTLAAKPQYVPLPAARPLVRFFRGDPHPVRACRSCTLRRGAATAVAWEYRDLDRCVCLTHHRWINSTPQFALAAAPEIVTAQTDYNELVARYDQQKASAALFQAWNMTTRWVNEKRHPDLIDRWNSRAVAIGATGPAKAAVRFPEMVQVAQVLTDPDWRRHVAMVELHHLDNFYRHTAKVLGADREGFITDRGRVDPLCEWAQDLRTRHAATRARFWSDLQLNHARYRSIRRPFPESRHFT
ncbi:TniQ family protein [Streptomyces brasiliscabiei]|uniref:TniQ family protein n=1 Tax=Streptomyces brasiliscabiei TaxID=2736302 RepID=UPI001C106F71|nr:TniQ family protein [Streptomyces brasiliscabiei]